MAKRRFCLLLVDDEPDVLDLLRETFADDYQVLTAPSGWTALDLLRTHSVDLMITDQRMPGITGVQLAERAHVDHPHLPVIILTAYTDPPDLIAAINKGQVHRFITKPWDVPHLLQTVEQALESVRLRRENAALLVSAQRRLEALKVMLEMLIAASAHPGYAELVDTVSLFLESVVPLDLSATLVRADPARPAELSFRLRTDVEDSELARLKELMMERLRALTDTAVAENDIVVRVAGKRLRANGGKAAERLGSTLFMPLRSEGRFTGLLCVAARDDDAFSDDDATLLDLLANHAAELVGALKKKLDKERARLSRMVEGMGDGLLFFDSGGELAVSNGAARDLLGAGSNEPITSTRAREVLAFYPFEAARGAPRATARMVANDVEVAGRVLRAVVSPVDDVDGKPGGTVAVLHDVTTEREIAKRREDVFADVSHELRTPLTAVAGAIDLMLMRPDGLNEQQVHYLTIARSGASRMHSTIDDLLDISRAARLGLELDLQRCVLDDIVKEAVERFGPSFEVAGSKLELVTGPAPVNVVIDPARAAQVLNNLIGNALKYTPQGKRAVIEVFLPPEVAGAVGVSVRNEGDQISDDDRERIFLPFQKARAKEGRRIKGTGLGLPIARTIVEAHHGRIWAERQADGARFIAIFPVDGPGPIAPNSPAPADDKDGKALLSDAPRVLVVDDDRLVGYAIKGVLLAAGFMVDLATSADEALAFARQFHPKAFVVDMRMPTVDGAQLIEILRHDPDTRDHPVLAVSSPDGAAAAKKAGADGFLEKPIDGNRLVALLAQLTQARRAGARVLVVDDEPVVRRVVADLHKDLGYAVESCGTAHEALALIGSFRPDVIILDVVLPDGDGLDILEDIKAARATKDTSVIVVSARSDTRFKVRALQLGADDYVVKPFDALELCARVESVLRRRDLDDASGSTALPGSVAIDRSVNERINKKQPFTLCYVDLDNFKAFNDTYGYARADGVIHQTSDLLKNVVEEHGGVDDFVGHIAGDDFVFIASPERAAQIAKSFIRAFDRLVPLYYNKEDRERGYIEADDRFGQRRRFPIMGVSVVGVADRGGRFGSHGELSALAAALKKDAKAVVGSVWVIDDAGKKVVEKAPFDGAPEQPPR